MWPTQNHCLFADEASKAEQTTEPGTLNSPVRCDRHTAFIVGTLRRSSRLQKPDDSSDSDSNEPSASDEEEEGEDKEEEGGEEEKASEEEKSSEEEEESESSYEDGDDWVMALERPT